MTIQSNSDKIKIANHIGTWYVIDSGEALLNGTLVPVFLLEHEQYGDETAWLIVNENGDVLLDDVWNGFLDLEEAYDTAVTVCS